MANAILAAILSLILPGLGQFIGGQETKKAIIFFVIAIIIYSIIGFTQNPLAAILYLFNFYAAYDAYTNIEN